MEGYDFDVVGEEVQDYKCPICLMLLRDAVLMSCSHSACTPCLKKWGEQTTAGAFHCPSCRSIYIKEKVYEKNRFIDRIITTSLKVKCKNHMKTCEWTGTISDFEFHERYCLYASVMCGCSGCNETMCRKDLMEHEEVCLYRVIRCEFCSFYIPHNQLEEHHLTCEYFEVACPLLCQSGPIPRKDVQTHIEFYCPNTEMKCPLLDMGCTKMVLRKNVEKHFNDTIMEHTQILLGFVFDLKTEIQQLKNISASQNDEIEELKRNKIEQCVEIEELKKFKTRFQIELVQLQANLLKISEIEKELEERALSRIATNPKPTEQSTSKKCDKTVKLHEDGPDFYELSILISNKWITKRFVERINSRPELALLCNSSGLSLLHDACIYNNTSCVDVLLKHGCPINHENNGGFQSIHYAAMNGSIDAAKRIFSIDGTLVNTIHYKYERTPLHYAALRNQEEFVRFLLQQPSIQVNAKDYDNKMADEYHNTSQQIKQIIRQHRSR